MSHPLYNPYASGNQSSTQGQYGPPSIQAERDTRGTPSHLGPGPSFSSSGASSAIPGNSGGILPSPISQSMSYRPEQSRTMMDKDIERSIDMHISRAKEGVRVLDQQMHKPIDQDTRFTSTQRDEFCSSGTGMASYPMSSSSVSLGHRPSDAESGSCSMDWSLKYASSGDGRFNAPSGRDHDMQSIPGLGDYDYPVQDKPAAPSESSRPKYTSESAVNILQQFGLEKEDLEHLISYPEDQITPANLPFILRQIRIQKGKKVTAAVQSKPYPEPQPTRSSSAMESGTEGTGMCQEEISSAVFQPSKVIDYGHTSKYTGALGDDIGRTSGSRANSGGSGSTLLMDSSRHSQEPLQKSTTEVKSSALGSSHEQTRSVTSSSFSHTSILKSVALPSHDQTKQLHTQPNQNSQMIPSSFSLPKKDTDNRVLKSEAIPVKEPEAAHQSTSKTKPTCTLLQGVHPSKPGLVLLDSDDNSGAKEKSTTRARGSTGAEQMKKQQPQQLMQKQPMLPMRKQPMQQMQKQPKEQQTKQQKQKAQQQHNQPVAEIPSITGASQAVRRPMITGDPRPNIIPPSQPRPIPDLMSSNRQPRVFKGLPTPTMMQDYAAISPRVFPHTCSLCSKEFTHMKDWISHQYGSIHIESCKLLRKQYPEWDGKIAAGPRAAGKDAKPSPSASAQTSQHCHQKTRHRSRSRSRSSSPRHHHSSERRREKRSSRSPSPHSSRYTRRSSSGSRSPRYDRRTSSHYRSHSGSSERRLSPRRRDEKWSSPRRNDRRLSSPRRSPDRQSPPWWTDKRSSSPRRSRDRQSPPWWADKRSSSPRRSPDRQSPPWWTDKRTSSPRRSPERQSPSWRTDKRLSSPRKSPDRRLPPRRSDEIQSPPRRSREKRSSTEGSSLQQKKPSNAERLVKKLLEPSAVQSLSNQSDLETMVKTLAPAILAEIKKIKSSSSSASSSTAKKKLTSKLSKAKPSLQKSKASFSTKTKSGKASPPTMVKLQGIHRSLSYNDVVAAVEQFGKTKSVVLLRFRLEAVVCFEKEEDAKKLKSVRSFKVKGFAVTVVSEKETGTIDSEQKKPLKKKPAMSSVFTPQTSTFTTTTANRKVLLPTPNMPLPSGAKQAKTIAVTNQKIAAKGSVKDLTTVTKAKVLVSKAKNLSTKQIAKTVKKGEFAAKGTVKMAAVKRNSSKSSGSKSTGQGLETKTEPSRMKQRDAGTEAAVQEKLTGGGVKTKTMQKAKTQTNAASAKDASVATEPTAAAVSEKQQAVSTPSSTAVMPLYTGDMVAKHLHPNRIACHSPESCLSQNFFQSGKKQLLITGLPKFSNACYTEEDIAKLLIPYGFQHGDDTIYVVPQIRMAFAVMPTVENVHNIIKVSIETGFFLKGSRLNLRVIAHDIARTPFEFYESLMGLMESPVQDNGSKTIFIKNISPSAARDLRETLKRISCVRDYLPLLNKVFIEFESIYDADRLGVWYSLLKQVPGYEVHRLKIPHRNCKAQPPKLPENALPDSKDAVAGATIPPLKFDVPPGSIAPFWVTMRTSPFLFPTMSPWFIIPDYLTVTGKDDIEASGHGSRFPTVMLTSLPEGNYTHEDVVRLVWRYFPKQNLHSLYYNVMVLPLQRRAFVFFTDWTRCCNFVQDHITDDVPFKGCKLSVHFVLDHMNPESSEEMMYKSLMKWSNIEVPEPESLEERLLNVEISETSLDVIRTVMEAVSSIATFVNFLPLANRICIEMADSSGVTQVVEKYKTFSPDSPEKRAAWSKVQRFETLKSLKQCLQNASEIIINSEPDKPPAVRCQTQPPPGLSDDGSQPPQPASDPGESTISEPITAGPSDTAMEEDGEKPGSEIAMDSTVDPVTAAKTQTDAASAKDASVTTEQTAATQPATAAYPLTLGDNIETCLSQKKFQCFKLKTCFKPAFHFMCSKHLLIRGLPKFYDGLYTEEDLSKLLTPFGFQYGDDNIYILPQSCMAVVVMPTTSHLVDLLRISGIKDIVFRQSALSFSAMTRPCARTPFEFFERIMTMMKTPTTINAERTIFIKNISWSDARDLRNALSKITLRNYLPLLNKVFIEFASLCDTDHFGVRYSLLKQLHGYEVYRMKVPEGHSKWRLSELPENAALDHIDDVVAPSTSSVNLNIPQGTMAPLWVPLRNSPFVFPTMAPWFIIPDYHTVGREVDIEWARCQASMIPTIMLTGLPQDDYKHEDVAKRVWRYFPKQNLHFQYYNVMVLPLQRRAFVFFTDWTTCCDFVRDHLTNPISVKGFVLSVHFVMQPMNPGSSEETMYKSLMKWSNARVSEPESLEERLLCVKISQTSVGIIRLVMEVVSSIATFVSFLPLANRICIEMTDSSGVTQVVEKYKNFTLDSLKKHAWSKIEYFETLKSLKQRLHDSSEKTINFGPDTIYDGAKTPAEKCQTQPPPSEPSDKVSQPAQQTSDPGGSTISELITAASDEAMKEDGEKPGTEIATDSTGGPEANEDVETVKGEEGSVTTSLSTADVTPASAVSSGNAVPAASSLVPSATELKPEENFSEDLQSNTDVFNVLTAALRQHKLTQGSGSQSETKEGPDDFFEDIISSDSDLDFDEQDLNLDDFVTVDEVGVDVEDTSPEPHRSSPSSSTRARRERQSSGVSSACKRSSTRSSKDNKSSASSSSSPSKSTKGTRSSNSSSASPKKSKYSSEPIKSPTKSSTSASVSKASSSSPLCAKTSSSPVQKTEQNRTKSPSKASNIRSSGRCTRSSYAAREKEKITSAADDANKQKEEEDDDGETFQILDSLDAQTDEHVDDRDQNSSSETQQTGPEDSVTLKKGGSDSSKEVADEEEATYQILDSVEDETVDDQPHTGQSESLRKENIFKDDHKQNKNSTSPSGSTKKEEEEEAPMYQILDSLEGDQEELTATDLLDTGRKEKGKTKDETPSKEEASAEQRDAPTRGTTVVEASEKVIVKEESVYQIVDDVEEVNDAPSTSEGLGTGNKESTSKTDIKKEDKSTTKSHCDTVTPREKKKEKSPEKNDTTSTLILDKVSAEEEDPPDSTAEEVELRKRQAATKEKQLAKEQEARMTREMSLRSAKRKHDDDTEESINFVTVDEVGEEEEEEEEEEKEVVTTRTRGRPKKRTRQTPVRKSTRGKKVSTKDEREEEKEAADVQPPTSLDASSSLDKDPSTLSSDGQSEVQKTEVEAASQADVDAASAGQQLQPEPPEKQTLEGGEEEKEGRSRVDIKVGNKQRREPVGPEAKRSRSQSPCVAADFKLPAFKPNNPLGQEFMVLQTAYFCNLCSVFCLNESSTRDLHCSSQTHYDNLQKHYETLEEKPSRSSTQSSQGSVPD